MRKTFWAIVLFVFMGSFLFPNYAKAFSPVKEGSKEYKLLHFQNNTNAKNLYEEKVDAVQVFNFNGQSIYITNKDVDLMAKVVYAESCSEPYEGKVAVASVILNRLQNPQFPKSVTDVVKQKYAFSCVRDGDIPVTPNKECYSAVFDALSGKDPTPKAIYFYNPQLSTSSWMNNIKKNNIKIIGKHVFFVVP
ncbi:MULTISPECIES: cell wall hydrolase [Clostridium]|uniref:cell wall hydrolase n=1 Tax=Clostridium TaxID=1485 RepID=UPI00069FC9DB|nr:MULTISPECIES: cell wall hydrolase [Clostridium]KOF57321.1 hydrolase [Clostridium sp. DMHC 10]MCD2347490.1 cell wall hydrolase [Clostridium guangxiense]